MSAHDGYNRRRLITVRNLQLVSRYAREVLILGVHKYVKKSNSGAYCWSQSIDRAYRTLMMIVFFTQLDVLVTKSIKVSLSDVKIMRTHITESEIYLKHKQIFIVR